MSEEAVQTQEMTGAIKGSPLAQTAWPVFCHDLQHTGRSQYEGPSYPHVKWRYATKYETTFSPVIGTDGTIYAGSIDKNLYALTPDGSLKWRYQATGLIDSSPAICADGTIYFGSRDGYIYAINVDGSLKWRFKTGCTSFSSPAIAFDGVVYIGADDSNLYAINPDGSLGWQYSTGGGISSSPAIGESGIIIFGSDDKYLYALGTDGSLVWRYKTDGRIHASPAIDGEGDIYVGSDDGCLYAMNSDGSLKWQYETDGHDRFSTPAIDTDGTIYVGSYNGRLYAVNPSGSLRWSYETEGDIRFSPTIDSNNTIFFGSYDGYLYAVNTDGSLKWRFKVTGTPKSPIIGHGGILFLCSTSQYVHALGSTPVAIVNSTGIPLREGPGPKYPLLDQMEKGDELAVIGRSGNCDWLKVVTSDQKTGWINNQNNNLKVSGECTTIPGGTFRPMTGYVDEGINTLAHGELAVENGTSADAVVILTTLEKEPVISAYIRSNELFTLKGIQEGTYRVYFSMGSEWDGTQLQFTQNVKYERFEDILEFKITASSYTTYKITLHPVVGGTAATEYLDSNEFPNINN